MNAHELLERQLRASVVALAEPQNVSRPGRWRRPPRRLMLIAAALVLLVAGAAVAAKIIDHRSAHHKAKDLTEQALSATAHLAVCQPVGLRPAAISNATPSARVTRALPALATPPATAPPAGVLRLVRPSAGQALLRRTVRSLDFGGGVRTVLYVAQGTGPGGPADPVGCLNARLASVVALHPKADAVQATALGNVRARRETRPGAESISMLVNTSHRGPWAGSERVVPPTGLKPGMLLTRATVGAHRVFYAAVASPTATTATVRSAGRKLPAKVIDGALGFVAPASARRFAVRQTDAAGRPVGYKTLRVPR